MSALYGYANLNGDPAEIDALRDMEAGFFSFPWRAHERDVCGPVGLGYYDQETGFRGTREKQPIFALEGRFSLVVDGILDNRKELMAALGLQDSLDSPLGDCLLVLEAYRKWDVACASHLLGDFALAIWDESRKRLYLARDHTGKRTLYYKVNGDQLSFSTLQKPLSLMGPQPDGPALSEEWLATFLGIPTIRHALDGRQTIYEGVYSLLPGHYLTAEHGRVSEVMYWNPDAIKPVRLPTREAYHDAFREIFLEAVRCRIDTADPVGIMLSGGLDSSAVGCAAAGMLAEKGRDLKAYTAVPMAGYRHWLSDRRVADERAYVLEMADRYPNILPQFIASEGTDSLRVMPDVLEILEGPYKYIENSYWLTEITQQAAADGCKVLLDGQFGNATISYGNINQHLYELIWSMRLPELLSEAEAYCRNTGIRRKKFIKYYGHRLYRQVKGFGGGNHGNPIIAKDVLARYGIQEKLRASGYSTKPLKRLQRSRQLAVHPSILNHLAAGEVNFGLKYGLISRDPTRDKRVIEFCMGLPPELMVHEGVERRLVKDALKDMIPASILSNHYTRGLQGGDWLQRLETGWADILEEVEGLYQDSEMMKNITNHLEFSRLIRQNRSIVYSAKTVPNIRTIMVLLTVLRFIKNHKEDTQ